MAHRYLRNALVFLLLTTAAGCMVGPNFHTPAPPGVKTYTEKPIPAQTVSAPGKGGASQRLTYGENIPDQWWNLYHCKALDVIVRRAVKENPTMAAAEASLRQARENLNAGTATVFFPGVDGNFSATRERFSDASFGMPNLGNSIFTLYNASVSVSYVFDVFGGERRQLEALKAQVDYQRFLLYGAQLSLTANVVTAAIQEASLRARIRATEQIVAMQEKELKMVQRRFALGGAARGDVLAQQAQLSQTRATLPGLQKTLEQTRNQLAIFTGRYPGQGSLPEFKLKDLHLPRELPVSVPSSLVRQRPDIRAAEELLHAAGAGIGVATANLYPQISLSAGLGTESTSLQDMFLPSTAVWNVGSGLLQPIFHGGELLAKRRAAVAACDQAYAQYRQTVLLAFGNVADVLDALETDARTLRAQAQAEAVARASLELTDKQFQIGAASYLALLNAQRQEHLALIELVQAQTRRFADTAALFQALGKGWWTDETGGVKLSKARILNEKNAD